MGECRSALERALPVLRTELRRALGEAAAMFEGGALCVRVSHGRCAQVRELIDAIRGAERVIGRLECGPEWLDELIDGEREVVP